MEIKVGYLYHIKDEFFEVIKDKRLMSNHELGRQRPTYFTIKDKDILWFIPISSKVEKYKPIVDKKIKRYGKCNTILIRKILDNEGVILLQNAFPTLEKYIDHIHVFNGKPALVPTSLQREILDNFSLLIELHKKGKYDFFTNVDEIQEKLGK